MAVSKRFLCYFCDNVYSILSACIIKNDCFLPHIQLHLLLNNINVFAKIYYRVQFVHFVMFPAPRENMNFHSKYVIESY